jgi:glycosyltransferase involved in cell wall biosynthesis
VPVWPLHATCQQRLPKFWTIFLRIFGTVTQSIVSKPELAEYHLGYHEYHLGYQMSRDSSGLCEVRVPTFRRPKLLRRALLSVLEQTYGHWRCVVLDDCPDGSARSTVEAIQDHRIDYLQNPRRLGAVGNIDKSFFRGPMLGGNYAFVLEDDNYLLPDHIERSIGILSENNAKVAFCNQYCEMVDVPGEPGRIGNEKTLNWMYEEGIYSPDELLPALLFSHGFSNGAAFWRTDCLSDLQIGGSTRREGIQENLRLLRLREPVYVSLQPSSVWRSRDPPKSCACRKPILASFRRFASNGFQRVMAEKEGIDCRCAALRRLGEERVLNYIARNTSPDFFYRVAGIERTMLLCGYNTKLTSRWQADRLIWLLMGCIARYLIPTRLRL